MSLPDYRESLEIGKRGYNFRALIMAAVRQADGDSLDKLRRGWPALCEEFIKRFDSPGGVLFGEKEDAE